MRKKRTGDDSKIGMRVGTKGSIEKGKSDNKGVIKKGGGEGATENWLKRRGRREKKQKKWMRGRAGRLRGKQE